MVDGTLCIILDGDKPLLKLANRGISKGRWNFPGGKIGEGETAEQCVVRETLEETGIQLKNLKYCGFLDFFFENEKNLDWRVHIFSTKEFEGDASSTEEGEVRWFDLDKLPFEKMWVDDKIWVPRILKGEKISARFDLNKNGTKVLSHSMRELP